MRHFGSRRPMRRPRRQLGNAVIHVPSTMDGSMVGNTETLFVIMSPSIFAGGSASSNIEAQDKDRTMNVGHHMGRATIDFTVRETSSSGIVEFCVMHYERLDAIPAIGTHPTPTGTEISTQGLQQACRMQNPGRVVHYSQRSYTTQHTFSHKITFSPAKFRRSKCKAGDHWALIVHNRGSSTITPDFQCRYKEYE